MTIRHVKNSDIISAVATIHALHLIDNPFNPQKPDKRPIATAPQGKHAAVVGREETALARLSPPFESRRFPLG
ncbi:hypothetical protein Hypma_015813 [Hypsizygus marmoreus]|uniref:Uncharacterized protein n=1 Tax=Hypsizygus marmoreus TaxID=39966 RepID=A0A369KCV1_HYPMA|nr:hypothetical protein Hypma_015813 [Hypsizygus marmoreus]